MARAEARVALPVLFDRFPDTALAAPADDLEPLASLLVNGHRTVPVPFATPAFGRVIRTTAPSDTVQRPTDPVR
ncbi:hypothetical protein ACFZB5_30135 [Streptomyces nodosus]|uniref:hypothetical protein n=1 Tax=Streptomyces nodosus TaxID=40318 RepID=UPI0036DFF30C